MKSILVLCALLAAAVLSGCGPGAMMSNAKSRAQALDVMVAHPDIAGAVAERLVGSDSTRSIVIEKLLANGPARQELLFKAARDRTMMEGMLNVAVQDTAMRTHVMTLVRGMEMGGMH